MKESDDRIDYASSLRRLAAGQHVAGVSTMKGGYRRVHTYWLGRVGRRIERLEGVIASLVLAWESVPEDVQVPDEINVNELWEEARDAIGRAE